MAFAAERERSEQLALVNAVLRESAAMLSRERILETAVRRIQEAFRPCLVAMLVPEEAFFRRGRRGGPRRARRGLGGRRRWPRGRQGRALRERRTVVASEGEPGFAPQAAGARSALAVPILSGRRGGGGALRRGRPARAASTAAR